MLFTNYTEFLQVPYILMNERPNKLNLLLIECAH